MPGGDGTWSIVQQQERAPAIYGFSARGRHAATTIKSAGASAWPTPEPSTWAMMALGFAGLGFAGYRKQSKNVPVAA